MLLYEGYNDLSPGARNLTSARRQSPVFRWTGYFPIFPMILREKLMVLRNRGKSLDDVYAERTLHNRTSAGDRAPVVFTPRANDTTAQALEHANQVLAALRQQVGSLSAVAPDVALPAECEATPERRWYCDFVGKAVEYARLARKRVLVVGQPTISDLHAEQQRALARFLTQRFGADPDVSYYDVGRQLDLSDSAVAFDGMHLTVAGTEQLARILEAPVSRLLQEPSKAPR